MKIEVLAEIVKKGFDDIAEKMVTKEYLKESLDELEGRVTERIDNLADDMRRVKTKVGIV